MFTLAQYVFGLGKPEENLTIEGQAQDSPIHSAAATAGGCSPKASHSSSSSSCSSSSSNSNCDSSTALTTSTCESSSSHCVQTSIEDDWILIEVGDENSNLHRDNSSSGVTSNTLSSPTATSIITTTSTTSPVRKAKSHTKKGSKRSKSKQKSRKGEKWVVDPPECFINKSSNSKVLLCEAPYTPVGDLENTDRTDAISIQEEEDNSKENLLIEFPSNIVFESLFVKRADIEAAMEKEAAQAYRADELIESVVAEGVVEAVVQSVERKNRRNKKGRGQHMEPIHNTANNSSVNGPVAANPNRVLAETKKRKRSITRKHHERQNRVNMQRNGPIIRGKKMFTTLNGAYSCTRNQC